MSKVIISGYYGFSNLGDEAVLMSIVKEFKKAVKDINITVLSNDPAETSDKYQVDSIKRYNFGKIIRELKNADLFISGGGSLLQDVTSTRSLFYYLGLILLARKMNVPVAVYANGVGPLKMFYNRWLTAWVLNQTQHVSVRDVKSKKLLEKIGVEVPIHVAADPVFTLKPQDTKKGEEVLQRNGVKTNEKAPLMGICVRPWLGHISYREKLAKAVDFSAREFGVQTVFVPFNKHKDTEECRKVMELVQHKTYLIEEDLSTENMLNLISCFDLVIGVRLHSLIFSAVAQVPFIGISYDPKIDGFMRIFGLKPMGSIEKLELNDLLIEIENSIRSREGIKKKLREKNQEIAETVLKNNRRIFDMLTREDSA